MLSFHDQYCDANDHACNNDNSVVSVAEYTASSTVTVVEYVKRPRTRTTITETSTILQTIPTTVHVTVTPTCTPNIPIDVDSLLAENISSNAINISNIDGIECEYNSNPSSSNNQMIHINGIGYFLGFFFLTIFGLCASIATLAVAKKKSSLKQEAIEEQKKNVKKRLEEIGVSDNLSEEVAKYRNKEIF